MRNLALTVAVIAAALLGYFIGSWSGRSAKEALVKVELSAKEGQAQYQRTTQQLKTQLETLAASHEQEKEKISADFKKQMTSFDIAAKSRDQLINSLRNERKGIQADLQRAQDTLSRASTPEQRRAAQATIDELRQKEQVVATTVDGEVCANVKVPPSLLAALRGETQ